MTNEDIPRLSDFEWSYIVGMAVSDPDQVRELMGEHFVDDDRCHEIMDRVLRRVAGRVPEFAAALAAHDAVRQKETVPNVVTLLPRGRAGSRAKSLGNVVDDLLAVLRAIPPATGEWFRQQRGVVARVALAVAVVFVAALGVLIYRDSPHGKSMIEALQGSRGTPKIGQEKIDALYAALSGLPGDTSIVVKNLHSPEPTLAESFSNALRSAHVANADVASATQSAGKMPQFKMASKNVKVALMLQATARGGGAQRLPASHTLRAAMLRVSRGNYIIVARRTDGGFDAYSPTLRTAELSAAPLTIFNAWEEHYGLAAAYTIPSPDLADHSDTETRKEGYEYLADVAWLSSAASQSTVHPAVAYGTYLSSSTATPVAQMSPIAIEPGADTGTEAGKIAAALRSKLKGIQEHTAVNLRRFVQLRDAGAKSEINYNDARDPIVMQVSLKSNNADLVINLKKAQAALDEIAIDANSLNTLGVDVAGDFTEAVAIRDQVDSAMSMRSANDEDRRQLSVLDSESNQTIAHLNALSNAVLDDLQDKTNFGATQRTSLTATLDSTISNNEAEDSLPLISTIGRSNGPGGVYGVPLMVIKQDGSEGYRRTQLTSLATQVLNDHPRANFTVMAVSPARGTSEAVEIAQALAMRHAQSVKRALLDAGVPERRLSISATTNPKLEASEILIDAR